MRKLSYLLEVCSKYNVHFGGEWNGMCQSSVMAYERKEISLGERDLIRKGCSELVSEISSGREAYLSLSIRERFNIGDVSEAVRQIYGAWIDKLKSEGK